MRCRGGCEVVGFKKKVKGTRSGGSRRGDAVLGLEGRCFVCDTVGHISSNCPSKPNTASPRRDPPGSTPGPRMVAAIRAYEDTGDSTAFVGISSDSEDNDERLFASEPG
ncbi:BQ5605_C012g06777 [Microbotryum silenes-dioicae]|uniref:BQ5605_C012g06777 protein n=1 Tax=Microbotryum silenes-dioicae TaxID=796604 RepID=A0A2X0MDD7_9BASI|nr:BQ5605_C012g06777 [Microbotryum silenes-dioicae]